MHNFGIYAGETYVYAIEKRLTSEHMNFENASFNISVKRARSFKHQNVFEKFDYFQSVLMYYFKRRYSTSLKRI